MIPKKTLQERENELRSLLATPAGKEELQELASRYSATSGTLRPAGTSDITYILVHAAADGHRVEQDFGEPAPVVVADAFGRQYGQPVVFRCQPSPQLKEPASGRSYCLPAPRGILLVLAWDSNHDRVAASITATRPLIRDR